MCVRLSSILKKKKKKKEKKQITIKLIIKYHIIIYNY